MIATFFLLIHKNKKGVDQVLTFQDQHVYSRLIVQV